MTEALVRIARLIDDHVWNNPESVGSGRELYWGGALKLNPGAPVRIDHIKTRNIGRVLGLIEFDFPPGRWVFASCEIDEPPEWLRRGTAASMSWCNLGVREPMPGGWLRHNAGLVTEVSVLSPGVKPAEPGAQVVTLNRTSPPPAAPATPPATVLHGGGVIRRPGIGQVLAVR
jgi:hypothetical protein